MEAIRLVATDIDGTLLDPCGKLTDRTRRAVEACEARGVPVVLSSGRTFESLRLLAREIGLNGPIISCNGGRVDASPFGPVILEDVLPLELADPVFSVLAESGLYIECYTQGTIYQWHAERSPFSNQKEYLEEWSIPDEDGFCQRFVHSLDRMDKEGRGRAYKFAAFSRDPEQLKNICRQLRGLPLEITSAFPFNIEIMERGRGKGRALASLAEHLGIPIRQVMAIGDGTNDRTMIERAGLGVAMGNASEELKLAADLIVSSNAEDGMADALERFVLMREN